MLSVYRTATGRCFVFDKRYPREGQFFYGESDRYYDLNLDGFQLGVGGNHASFQNVCAGITGRFSFDDETLTVLHDTERFTLDAGAVFDPEAITSQPVRRYIRCLCDFPDAERLLYLSYAMSGRYRVDYKVYIVREGVAASGLPVVVSAGDPVKHLARYPTSKGTFVWPIPAAQGPYRASWEDIPLTEVPFCDYNIIETLEGTVVVTKK